MTIIKNSDNPVYSKLTKALGYGYDIVIDQQTFHYEFKVNGKEACIKTDNNTYLSYVVDAFHQTHKAISIYYTTDRSFYKSFDEPLSFLLPISILQVSKCFLSQEKLELLKDYEEETYFPVQIIDDEYVLLDKHHLLYIAYQNNIKMVPVYIEEAKQETIDFVYLAKEQNMKSIKDLSILPDQEYQAIQQELNKLFKH